MIGEVLEGGYHLSTLPDGKKVILSPKSTEKLVPYAEISLLEAFLSIDGYDNWFIPDTDLMVYLLQHYNIMKDTIPEEYEMRTDKAYWSFNETESDGDYAKIVKLQYGGVPYLVSRESKKLPFYVRAFKMI
jgi:hypothetical protein